MIWSCAEKIKSMALESNTSLYLGNKHTVCKYMVGVTVKPNELLFQIVKFIGKSGL